MEKIRNLSIKKTIVLYMLSNLVISFVLSAFISRVAETVQRNIWLKYVDEDRYAAAVNAEKDDYEAKVPRPAAGTMSRRDYSISESCDFLETYSLLLPALFGTVVVVLLFYRNKIKVPLRELTRAAQRVAANDLDFRVGYENRDELGKLCVAFEKMRTQLARNNQDMWRQMEQEQELRAAIAHDLRSPLSVLSGYQEMLLEFIPDRTLTQDQVLEMLRAGQHQLTRINEFMTMLQDLSALEERPVRLESVPVAEFARGLAQTCQILAKQAGKHGTFVNEILAPVLGFDRSLVLEVAENLLANALRFATQSVTLSVAAANHQLRLTVSDDGAGFLEAQAEATRHFRPETADGLTHFRTNSGGDLKHFGLGLYICRLYCEKHGGKLLIGNAPGGGGEVQATFQLDE